MRDKSDCGCTHDGSQWLKLCALHSIEENAVHAAWALDHKRHTDARTVEQSIIEELI